MGVYLVVEVKRGIRGGIGGVGKKGSKRVYGSLRGG